MSPDAKGVESVDRALALMACFIPEGRSLSLAELSEKSSLYKSTILRLSHSLERANYLVRDSSGRFRLGPTLWTLGSLYRSNLDFSDLIRPELAALSEQTGETASFYVRDGNRRICLFRCVSQRAIRHSFHEGRSLPIDESATGQIMQAYGDAPGAERDAIRAAGYGVSFGSRDPDVASVAVPVLSATGGLLGVVTVSGPRFRFTPEVVARCVAMQQTVATRLASEIAG